MRQKALIPKVPFIWFIIFWPVFAKFCRNFFLYADLIFLIADHSYESYILVKECWEEYLLLLTSVFFPFFNTLECLKNTLKNLFMIKCRFIRNIHFCLDGGISSEKLHDHENSLSWLKINR